MSCLSRGSSLERRPLFVRVFWQHDSSSHITLPIRKLLDTAISLLAHPHPNEMEVHINPIHPMGNSSKKQKPCTKL